MIALAFVGLMLRTTVPYVLAALGGTLSERSGVINLALEGMMLAGAFFATLGAYAGGASIGVPLGIVGGIAGGLLLAAVYALAVLAFRADQVVAGVAVNLLALGVTRYLLKLVFHSASSSPKVPGFAGEGAGYAFALATAALVALVYAVMYRTPWGLRLRAVGDNPAAAQSLGVVVARVRVWAVMASGMLAGLAGAWLALDNRGFVDEMSGGRGYIALAAMIFGRWQPLRAALACLLFGAADALQVHLQAHVGGLPRELLATLPYVVTLLALMRKTGSTRAPAALGKPPAES